MKRLDVLDELLAAAPDDRGNDLSCTERASEVAAAFIVSSLAEAGGLRALDDLLYPKPSESSARRVAQSLHDTWARWADEAGALLGRVTRLRRLGHVVPQADELGDAHGRAMAMLKLTLEKLDRALDQVRRGEVITIEEVRRELRAGTHR